MFNHNPSNHARKVFVMFPDKQQGVGWVFLLSGLLASDQNWQFEVNRKFKSLRARSLLSGNYETKIWTWASFSSSPVKLTFVSSCFFCKPIIPSLELCTKLPFLASQHDNGGKVNFSWIDFTFSFWNWSQWISFTLLSLIDRK